MSDQEDQIAERLDRSISKYTYFLMAFAASSTALSASRTTGVTPQPHHFIILGAVLAWAVSIFCGLLSIKCDQRSSFLNWTMIRISEGVHPGVGSHLQGQKVAVEELTKVFRKLDEKGAKYSAHQMNLLIAGSILFLIWHVIDMFITAG